MESGLDLTIQSQNMDNNSRRLGFCYQIKKLFEELALASHSRLFWSTLAGWIAFFCLGFCVLVQAILLLKKFGFVYTDEDQTALWYVAKDFLAGYLREPCFPGQPYGTSLESLLAVPLLWLDIPIYKALPLISTGCMVFCFYIHAILALRLDGRLSASVILAIPFVLPIEAVALISMPRSFTPAFALASLGVFLLFWPISDKHKRSKIVQQLIGLLFLGMSWVASQTMILVLLPILSYEVVKNFKDKKFWCVFILVFLLIAITYFEIKNFYELNPGYIFHDWVAFSWNFSTWSGGWKKLGDFFGIFMPFGLPPDLLLIVGFLFCIYLVYCNKLAFAAFLSCFLAGVIGVLGVPRMYDGNSSLFFSYSRFFMAIPVIYISTIVLILKEFESDQARIFNRLWDKDPLVSPASEEEVGLAIAGGSSLHARIKNNITVLILIFSATILQSRIFSIDQIVKNLTSFNGNPIVWPIKVADLIKLCQSYQKQGQIFGANTIYFADPRTSTYDSIDAYACGALFYDQMDTLIPSSDRRTWRLEEEKNLVRTRILVKTMRPDFCKKMAPLTNRCIQTDQNKIMMIEFPKESALKLFLRAGLPVRKWQ